MGLPAPLVGDTYTVADLDRIDLPAPFELIHGDIVMMTPAKMWHNEVQFLLRAVLTPIAQAAGYRAVHEQGAILADDHDPVPDLMVIDAGAFNLDAHSVLAETVVLAVEIESGNRRKDRVVRPSEYAEAGIPHYWRIENAGGGNPVLRAFILDLGTYEPTGVFGGGDVVELAEPFPITFNITHITP